jgi:hypothetical protein
MYRKLAVILVLLGVIALTFALAQASQGEEGYPGPTWCDPLDPANAVPYPGVEPQYWGWTCPTQPTLAPVQAAKEQPEPEPTPTAWVKITNPATRR